MDELQKKARSLPENETKYVSVVLGNGNRKTLASIRTSQIPKKGEKPSWKVVDTFDLYLNKRPGLEAIKSLDFVPAEIPLLSLKTPDLDSGNDDYEAWRATLLKKGVLHHTSYMQIILVCFNVVKYSKNNVFIDDLELSIYYKNVLEPFIHYKNDQS